MSDERKSLTLAAPLHHRLKVMVAKAGTRINDETDAAIRAHIEAVRAKLKKGPKLK